jgi:hypothetical protein
MWLYPGSSCPDRPSFEGLGAVEINSRIHKVLDHGDNLNPGAGHAPLYEGVASTSVRFSRPVSIAYAILSLHRSHGHAQGHGGAHNKP